jgi:hypothetical protein
MNRFLHLKVLAMVRYATASSRQETPEAAAIQPRAHTRNMLRQSSVLSMGPKSYLLSDSSQYSRMKILCSQVRRQHIEYHVIPATSSCVRRLKDHMLSFFFLRYADPCSPHPTVRVDDYRSTFIGEPSVSNRYADL